MNTKRVAPWLVALIMGSAALAAETVPRAPVWKNLAPFDSAREFDRYRNRVHEVVKQRGLWWGAMRKSWRDHPLLVQNAPLPCNPAVEECPQPNGVDEVVVTGVRAKLQASMDVQRSPAATVRAEAIGSVTNNQVSGVDEGDIVKVAGRFFVVLHEGRLYSVDTGAGSGTLRVADRADAYQSKDVDSWIDEILIHGDTVLVTGYSYQVKASTIALFHIDRESGAFRFLARYFIESNDYFSGENYASRIVDGKLVIYTPLYLPEIPTDTRLPVPRIRAWTKEGGFTAWRPLFELTDVYRPVQATLWPALHVISVCPIRERAFQCDSRGIVGPSQREFYVAGDDAYLWLTGGDADSLPEANEDCAAGRAPLGGRGIPSAVYRVPIGGGDLTGVLTAGEPNDQFAFEQRRGQLWALVDVSRMRCEGARAVQKPEDHGLELARIPLRDFSARPYRLRDAAWFPVPKVQRLYQMQTRYAEDYLLYGEGRGLFPMLVPDEAMRRYYPGGAYGPGELVVVPLDAPRAARTLPLTHGVERVELFGAHALAFGYGGREGMNVSAIALDGTPRVAASVLLPGVAEAEGRSHAFNATLHADGSGLFGLPTLDLATLRSGRWGDTPSDVSFVSAGAALGLASADKLAARPDAKAREGYVCEVSCYDWYGNARPIFFRGRVFALTGREMIEGTLAGGRVVEIARVNLVN